MEKIKMSKRYSSLKERLLAYVEKTSNGCWEWKGATLRGGYGNMGVNGKTKQTHRLSYELFVGKIPKGLLVCHKCDNPLCCNPEHLFLGTHKTNAEDRVNKNRSSVGEDFPKSKLKEKEVLEIRRYLRNGITHRTLAKMFRVGKTCISYIAEGKTWSWLS